MITDRIPLSADDPDAYLVCYVPENTRELNEKPVPAMLVIPGGGYNMCSDREAEPIALAYVGYGCAAFVMRYSVREKSVFPTPLIEASRAMKYIKDNAARFNIDPERVFCVGFSAGGHLAAALASMWKDPEVNRAVDMPYGCNKPAGAVISYGVVSYDGGPASLFEQIASDKYSVRELSMSDSADEDCAPMFIWQTSDDPVVDVTNALNMAAKLHSLGKQFELHIFPAGPHGIALANEITKSGNPPYVVPSAQKWVALSFEWMNGLGK